MIHKYIARFVLCAILVSLPTSAVFAQTKDLSLSAAAKQSKNIVGQVLGDSTYTTNEIINNPQIHVSVTPVEYSKTKRKWLYKLSWKLGTAKVGSLVFDGKVFVSSMVASGEKNIVNLKPKKQYTVTFYSKKSGKGKKVVSGKFTTLEAGISPQPGLQSPPTSQLPQNPIATTSDPATQSPQIPDTTGQGIAGLSSVQNKSLQETIAVINSSRSFKDLRYLVTSNSVGIFDELNKYVEDSEYEGVFYKEQKDALFAFSRLENGNQTAVIVDKNSRYEAAMYLVWQQSTWKIDFERTVKSWAQDIPAAKTKLNPNNSAVTGAGKTDLVVVDMFQASETLIAGDPNSTIVAEIKNMGDTTVWLYTADVYISSVRTRAVTIDKELKPGESVYVDMFYFEYLRLMKGKNEYGYKEHTFNIIIDAGNQTKDTNTQNNTMSKQFQFNDKPPTSS
ncbi:MAG TPA: CARDB domain-containing protein [Patescibacteria group bacterium]|nr:CARDB domain-containing protein [Patescibacteria group bacterium]